MKTHTGLNEVVILLVNCQLRLAVIGCDDQSIYTTYWRLTNHIGHNAYCSRDINLQFKKLLRTVILLVIIHRRTISTHFIGCYVCAAMVNTNNRYCLLLFSLFFTKITHLRAIPVNETKRCIRLDWFRSVKEYKISLFGYLQLEGQGILAFCDRATKKKCSSFKRTKHR